jgi:hypothetical protein
MTNRVLRMSSKWLTGLAILGSASNAGAAPAKTLIDYFLPMPIVCPLTSNTWGAAGVLPRDTCNGLEDATDANWNYWDGKILLGKDGKYRMYAGRWPQNKGFADWPQSVIVQATSNGTVIGSYVPDTATPFTGKEQNVTGMPLNDGSFALLDSPGKVYTASSLDGPWAALGAITVTANGSTISSATTENQTIWQSADNSFLVISRTFQEMTSPKNITGPYAIQATIPSLQSQGYEDPVVWCSGGQYHLVANMYNARKAMHFTSADGIHDWTNQGLAYDPTSDFVRYTDGTVNHWYKAERPGVVLQNGHVTAFTFAVIDVDKTLDLANDKHGSKIIVVPFDGVSFDHDNPGPGSAGCPLTTVEPGDAGAPVDGGNPEDAGQTSDAGNPDASEAGGTGGAGAGAGGGALAGVGGSAVNGGVAGSAVTAGGSNQVPGSSGSAATGDGPTTGSSAASGTSGCSCNIETSRKSNGAAGFALLVAATLAAAFRRRRERPEPLLFRTKTRSG